MFKKMKEGTKTMSENIKEYNRYKANKKGLLVDTEGNPVVLTDAQFDMEKVKKGKKEKRGLIIVAAVGTAVAVGAGVTLAVVKSKKSNEPEAIEGDSNVPTIED